MEEKNIEYDKEMAEIFVDPYKYAVTVHISNIKSPNNTVEIKKEYIEGLETILVKQDISTAASIFKMLGDCTDLISVPGVEDDVCRMLGYIAQNVEPVAKELLRCGVVKKCMDLYKDKPEAVNGIVFLFTILNNTLSDFSAEIKASGEDPSIISQISKDGPHITSKSQERLAEIIKSLAK
ncbi:hypothetical protein NEPAR06_0918 [Nematocida parisii]|uniref:Nucleotide exchange factor Fes1 domain-containing protein n=1 Tax=Nematocida parisii (strain ERTm3) TaxID=935791 RepID=I3EDS8_NEMP3|nr:hypothetical protein NEQG_02498 [Nematocida parisii ERTm3]KAI5127567.1 hypothetical protein NEPAR08_0937 [Nematocida parisii]KAI5127842.1 hypothetical protein NEPAR03_1122 [Nematocida parisii]KAI5141642.1 hypothetical protein NEPAR04_1119 [Nematocida parisii]KAI5145517.1 hypothetical protein NEPAR07_1747 [Nematocida parisii]